MYFVEDALAMHVVSSPDHFFRFICGGFFATTNKNGKKQSGNETTSYAAEHIADS